MNLNANLEPRAHLPSEACPSELELDRFHHGELRAAKEDAVARHLEDCSVCSVRLRTRERGFAAFESVDADRLFARVQSRLDKPSWLARIRRALLAPPVFLPVAAAACAAFLLVSRPPAQPEESTIQIKGGLSLSVFREHEGAIEELASGAIFQSGDRVRFKIRLPEQTDRSQILIVGVEESGKLYTYYPSDGSNRSAAPKIRPDGGLAGAIRLDAYAGDEWLHLVHCPRGFSIDELEKRAPEAIGVPKECERASFLIKRAD